MYKNEYFYKKLESHTTSIKYDRIDSSFSAPITLQSRSKLAVFFGVRQSEHCIKCEFQCATHTKHAKLAE